ncbi:fibronectin type III domain-containing protein [Herbiconiux sp. L3-i23]|uniref:fibronectin type III domain-containing protein n=1 Tax=Herbiconiux sp. L3-i23 TaxID=2905871 RepID=UPI0020737259|nr:fibronectin type III domain-containing protein [Herbiconiux sp. L3-i23]
MTTTTTDRATSRGRLRLKLAAVLTAFIAVVAAVIPTNVAFAYDTRIMSIYPQLLSFWVSNDYGTPQTFTVRATGPQGQVLTTSYAFDQFVGTWESGLGFPVDGNWTVELLKNGVVQSSQVISTDNWAPTAVKQANGSVVMNFPNPGTSDTTFNYSFVPSNPSNPTIAASNVGVASNPTTVTVPASSFVSGETYTVSMGYRGRVWGYQTFGPTEVVSSTMRMVFGAPTSVVATAGDSSASLAWAAPSPAPTTPSYRVKYKKSSDASWSTFGDVTGTTASVTGLTNGTPYDFSVTTLDAGGEQTTSSVASATPYGAPAAPVIGLSSGDNGRILTSVTFPTSAAQPSQYSAAEWQYAPTSTNTWTAATVSGSDPFQISGLTNGTDYRFRVRAKNGMGSSAWVTSGVLRPVAAPAAPTVSTPLQWLRAFTVSAVYTGTTQAPVVSNEWQITEMVAGSPVGWTAITPAVSADGVTRTFDNLTAGTEYRVRTRAINSAGAGAWTESSTVRAIAEPAQPVIGSLTPADGRILADVSFPSTDANPSNANAAVWHVGTTTDGVTSWSRVYPVLTDGVWVISGLDNGTAYRLRVYSMNSVAGSQWRYAAAPVTPVELPGAPVVVSATRGDASLSARITVPSSAAAPSTGVEWQIATVTSGVVGTYAAVTPTVASGLSTFSGLANGTDYRLRVRSINQSGAGSWVETATLRPIAAAGTPVIGTVAAANGEVRLQVTFPTSAANPSAAADAEWEYAVAGSNPTWQSVTPTSGSGLFSIQPLIDGTDYLVRVRANNASGPSAWAQTSSFRPITAPEGPEFTSMTAGDSTLSVTIDPHATDAAPIDSLTWEITRLNFQPVPSPNSQPAPASPGLLQGGASPAHDGGWTHSGSWVVATPTLIGGTYVFSGLTNGETYRVRVRATNRVDTTRSTSGTVAPIAAPDAPRFVIAGPQDGAIVSSLAGTSTAARPVTSLEWQIARTTGATAGRWTAASATDVGTVLVDHNGVSSIEYNAFRIDGLENGAGYQLRVRTRNAMGASSWTAWNSTVTPSAATTPDHLPATDPTPATGPDTDGDGIPNAIDPDIDGDGIPNGTDPDVDGDGVNNVFDPDVDGDGVPNASDPDADGDGIPNEDDETPNGIGTPGDIDGDGIPNENDADIDGDGRNNAVDDDIDGDGVRNEDDDDADGDGSPNGSDETPNGLGDTGDLDGDGIPNGIDPDVDGDGVNNVFDDDIDGDGIPNGIDSDADGDGIPNGSDSTPNGIGTPGDIDGDGIPNEDDVDMDGDGRNNANDDDIDGDGIPNASDETPAGPGSQPGDAGLGTSDDLDGDGIRNEDDPDIDGDGVNNVFDDDIDGDGIPNGSDSDADGDAIPNASDSTPNGLGTPEDIDGDGIRNEDDADMDGDGVNNVFDDDIDGDGIPNASDPTPAGPGSQPGGTGTGTVSDIDGDGIPNELDPDIDGDGVNNVFDDDIDGDGIRNEDDADADGDGIPNGSDSTPHGIGTPEDIDGDGIRNEDDADMDGDGVNNVFDDDIDGDGIPNASDPTPAGPGSQPTGTGPGRPGDIDGDGIPDAIDDDIDGDGIPNGVDPDVDGDGIPNGQDPDVDGDGLPNGSDPDVDGDGIPNGQDPDVDGDGLPNGSDPDVDGDGIPNGSDPDVDGDGIPNGSDPDVDGDGINNVFDPDVDGDGVPNASDPDADGDGIPNGSDETPNGIGTPGDIDGDGIPNDQDSDIDGDGRNNANDDDIDGDGVPNGSDPTPAGPGSQPGDTGVGTSDDIDGDGIPNGSDPDVDGDGIPNGQDPDVDGDGIPNGLDPDVDGDGIPNGSDPDVDGDGIPNGQDPDVDGDGVNNVFDPDVDGDGVPNGSDSDADGDGIPNGSDETPNGIGTPGDIDGDGIPNELDTDIDGDGIPNASDPDVDGDGIPNITDPDDDNDGTPDVSDSTPTGPNPATGNGGGNGNGNGNGTGNGSNSGSGSGSGSGSNGGRGTRALVEAAPAAAASTLAAPVKGTVIGTDTADDESAGSSDESADDAAASPASSATSATDMLVTGGIGLLILMALFGAAAWWIGAARTRRKQQI